jgi:hypothetical protein
MKMKMTDRSCCNDFLCCILFLCVFGVMIAISAFAFAKGDPRIILTPFDSDGNRCGFPN